SFWICDLVLHSIPEVDESHWKRYADYLTTLKGPDYPKIVFDYIHKEDSPRPIMEQIRLLETVGFKEIEILHKNNLFAAFGARKDLTS
ncbi:MAG: class I SAM-dependent methyltransferase, partial [Verrucomicrobiota bacterium]